MTRDSYLERSVFSRSEESGSLLEAPEVSQQQKPQQHLIGGMKAKTRKYRRKNSQELASNVQIKTRMLEQEHKRACADVEQLQQFLAPIFHSFL